MGTTDSPEASQQHRESSHNVPNRSEGAFFHKLANENRADSGLEGFRRGTAEKHVIKEEAVFGILCLVSLDQTSDDSNV